jgi:hypothetical protein
VSRGLTSREVEVIEIIKREQPIKAREIAMLLGMPRTTESRDEVQGIMNKLRTKHKLGIISRVYTTPQGYTLIAIDKNIMADARLSLRMSTSNLRNHRDTILKSLGLECFVEVNGWVIEDLAELAKSLTVKA